MNPRAGRLEKEMATPSSILAWTIPWTEEPGGLQSMGLKTVGRIWAGVHAHALLANSAISWSDENEWLTEFLYLSCVIRVHWGKSEMLSLVKAGENSFPLNVTLEGHDLMWSCAWDLWLLEHRPLLHSPRHWVHTPSFLHWHTSAK